MIRRPISPVLLGIWVAAGCLTASAQETSLPPVTNTIALTEVHVIPSPGQPAVFGTVLFRDGLIVGMGPEVVIPGNARVIPGDSMYVYAGFISGLAHAGIPAPEQAPTPERVDDPGNPSPERAGIQPQIRAATLIDPDHKDIASLREAGFTMAHTVPRGRMLPGQGAILLLHGSTPEAMLYREGVSLFSQWVGAQGVYPSNLLGVMATWKQLYRQADFGLKHETSYEITPAGKARPQPTPESKALYPVVRRELPVMFKANDLLSIQRAMNLSEELGFSLMLGEVAEAWELGETLAGRNLPIFLTLELPSLQENLPDPDTIADPLRKEQAMIQRRKQDMILKRIQQAAILTEAEVSYGFATMEVKTKDILPNLELMISQGLSPDVALSALTTTPARLLGLSKVAGVIAPGYLANLVMMEQPFGSEKNALRMTIVEGEVFTYEGKKKKKAAQGADATPIELAGAWSYEVESPQGATTGTITFKGEEGDYQGSIFSPRLGESVPLDNIEVEGNMVSFSYSVSGGGGTFVVEVELEVEGDEFQGNIVVGNFGTFDIEGERIP